MPLNNSIPVRNDLYQDIQFWRKRINFDGSGGVQGYAAGAVSFSIPAGSVIIPALSGIDTQTVFNAATNNRFQIGISGAVSKYGLNITAATLGFAPIAVAVGHRVAVDTTILFTPDITGGSETTGEVECVLGFLPPN